MAVGTATIGRRNVRAQRITIFLALALVTARLVVRMAGFADSAVAQTFTVIFTAIVVEALPFVLLGAVVSAFIEVYVSDNTLGRITRLPVALQLPAAALGGFAFPVCECGSVPVARQLIRRGMHPSAGVAFMLASPIFGPGRTYKDGGPLRAAGGAHHARRRASQPVPVNG